MAIRRLNILDEFEHNKFSLSSVTATISIEEYSTNYMDIERFLSLCKQCSNYGMSWTCPPCTFDIEAYVSKYKIAHIVGTKIVFKDDTLKQTNTKAKVSKVCEEAMLYGLNKMSAYLRKYEKMYPDSICFLGSKCLLCGLQPCTRLEQKPCRHPKEVRLSLEAIGFDLAKTASDLFKIQLKWGKTNQLPEYLTLITAIFTNHKELTLS